MRYHVYIETYECNCCGSCVALYPDLFYLNDLSGKVELTENGVYTPEKLAQAQAFCPLHCIGVVEEEE